MSIYSLEYRNKGGSSPSTKKMLIEANHAEEALEAAGWPMIQVFHLYIEVSYEEFEAMLAKNPCGEIMGFDDWQAAYGPANSPKYLWTRPRPPHPAHGRKHPQLDGKGSPIVCAHTGHVRFTSTEEFYGGWTAPDPLP